MAADAGHPIDLVTLTIARHPGANGFDGTCHVDPQDRGWSVTSMRGRTVKDLDVERIDAAGSNSNQDLRRSTILAFAAFGNQTGANSISA